MQNRLLDARRHDVDPIDAEGSLRRGERHRLFFLGQEVKQLIQPLSGLTCCDKAFPVGDRRLDRCKRTRRQDRCGDDDAGRRFLMDDQIGADREHAGLEEHAEHLRQAAETAGDIAGRLVRRKVVPVGLVPAFGQPLPHAHGAQDFGVSSSFRGKRIARNRKTGGCLGGIARSHLRQDCDADEHTGADQRATPIQK